MLNSPLLLYAAIALVFIVGALLYRLGSQRVSVERAQRVSAKTVTSVTWPQLVDEQLAGAGTETRLDIIERLGIVNTDWSRDILTRALSEETDEAVAGAIRNALG